MRMCSVMDCLYVDRATYLCTEPFIRIDARKGCLTYKIDMKYLRLQWHQNIRGALQSKGYVPETQEMVDIANSLRHTPSRKAGEEGN